MLLLLVKMFILSLLLASLLCDEQFSSGEKKNHKMKQQCSLNNRKCFVTPLEI